MYECFDTLLSVPFLYQNWAITYLQGCTCIRTTKGSTDFIILQFSAVHHLFARPRAIRFKKCHTPVFNYLQVYLVLQEDQHNIRMSCRTCPSPGPETDKSHLFLLGPTIIKQHKSQGQANQKLKTKVTSSKYIGTRKKEL